MRRNNSSYRCENMREQLHTLMCFHIDMGGGREIQRISPVGNGIGSEIHEGGPGQPPRLLVFDALDVLNQVFPILHYLDRR